MAVTPTFELNPNAAPLIDISNALNVLIANYQFRFVMPIQDDMRSELGTAPIPYNIEAGSPTFSFSEGVSTAQEVYIIRAQDMSRFVCNVLPRPLIASSLPGGGLALAFPGTFKINRRMPGNPLMMATSVNVEPLNQGLAMDPYGTDGLRTDYGSNNARDVVLDAWIKTYGHLARATVTYETNSLYNRRFDTRDPRTFCRYDAHVTGEFLNISVNNIKGRLVAVSPKVNIPAAAVLADILDPNQLNDQANWGQTAFPFDSTIPADEDINEFDLPLSQTIGLVEHSLLWKDVWDVPWSNITRNLGKVNREQLSWLNGAPPETVLFVGASATEQEDRANLGHSLWSLEYRFIEKRLWYLMRVPLDKNDPPVWTILTWNHFLRPKTGTFTYLTIGEDRRIYETGVFDQLFTRDVTTAPVPLGLDPDLDHNTERGIVPFTPHPSGCGYFSSQTLGSRA